MRILIAEDDAAFAGFVRQGLQGGTRSALILVKQSFIW